MFDLQPTLTGKLLTLRPVRPEDYANVYKAASDPLVWEQHPNSDRYKEEVFKDYWDGAVKSGGAFAVVENSTGEIVGCTRFYDYDEAKNEVAIGWTFLARKCWGGQHNTEQKKLMLEHAYKYVDRVLFFVGPTNNRSRKAIEKLGATYEESKQLFGGENMVYALRKADAEKGILK
jgi:RimJ/RimL family protein N-acetyltransferase